MPKPLTKRASRRAHPRLERVRRLRAELAADPEAFVAARLNATADRLLGALGGAA